MRTLLVLLVLVALLAVVISLVRGGGSAQAQAGADGSGPAAGPASDAGGKRSAEPTASSDGPRSATPETETAEAADADEDAAELVRTGTVGEGTWTLADGGGKAPEKGVVRTYAVRIEDGLGIDTDEAAREIAENFADERGWQAGSDTVFHRVADPEQAELTISIASPPTVDELCRPADTGGLWSCRIGPDVALNSDRWLHATTTYDDLAAYRAYMVNHEVGHFLGHDHVSCPGEDAPAPVMLQQSIDLQGCRANARPGTER